MRLLCTDKIIENVTNIFAQFISILQKMRKIFNSYITYYILVNFQ